MTEQQIQKQILTYLEKQPNSYFFKTITTNKSGIPDIIGHINGKFIAIEVKKPNALHTVTPIQQHNIDTINTTGGLAIVATSVADVKAYLNPSQEI